MSGEKEADWEKILLEYRPSEEEQRKPRRVRKYQQPYLYQEGGGERRGQRRRILVHFRMSLTRSC